MAKSQNLLIVSKKDLLAQRDEVIIRHVQAMPNNITLACENAAEELNIPFKTAHSRYYCAIRNSKKPIIALASKDTISINTKNTARVKDDKGEFNKELILGLFDQLSDKDKKQMIKRLIGL